MKTLVALFILFTAATFAAEKTEAAKPIPAVRLADGRVLRNVTFGKFNAETVLLRSASGPVAVRYDALPDDIRMIAERNRPGGAKWFAGDTSANTETIEGQLFITTAGAGSVKFGGVQVYAFDLAALSNFVAQGVVRLPKPIHVTTTDGDGKFTLKVPVDRSYFIFAQAQRFVDLGPDSYVQALEWRVPMNAVRKGQPLQLSGDHRFPPSKVEIEKS